MSTPSLLRSAPYFPVADVAATAAYYASTLGFTTEYLAGSPPVFAICTRDGLSVMLRRVERAAAITPIEAQGGTWDAFFWVRDATRLSDELRGAGAVVVYGPVRQPAYGMLEFAVRDPDGHVLGFGEAV
jgi:catechol 2,3-dioxygenase-like lactoylglutathione lyase family enzyme